MLAEAKEYGGKLLDNREPTTYYLFKTQWETELELAKRYGFTGVSITKTLLSDSLYNKATDYGLEIGTWTYYDSAEDDKNIYNHILSGIYQLDYATVDYKVFM